MPEILTVTYERKLSDGNYGSEGLSFSISVQLQHDELAEETLNDGTAEGITERVREFVLTQLSHSEAPRVAAVAAAELTGKPGRAWAESNAAAEERAIRGESLDDDQEALPF